MAKATHFIGAAGTYYVAHCLSVRNLHAAVTLGNAPGIDIVAAKSDGSGAVSIQVKTRWSGCRCRWYKNEVWQWDVGRKAVGHWSQSLVYAFVDYAESESKPPNVFIVPSKWVADTVGADWSRFIFPLRVQCENLTLERWDLLIGLLNGTPDAIMWATTLPKEQILAASEPAVPTEVLAIQEVDASATRDADKGI